MLGQPTSIGRYQIIDTIGRGGMGVLYRGRDAMLERDVAIKVMLVDFKHDPTARERFYREARAVARLQHRNVVTIHELGEEEGTPYIAMEFLTGRDLDAILHDELQLPIPGKVDIAIQLCAGLDYAHGQGIVHRDIKPSNVRVLNDGTVKILDFGIAKFAMSGLTQSGSIMGTAHYMAPEQIMGESVDGRADLFSAGVLLYEVLTGKKPFTGDTPTSIVYQIMHVDPPSVRTLVPDIPEALDAVVVKALQKKPELRYGRAAEMAADLQVVRAVFPGAGPTVTFGSGPAAFPLRGATTPPVGRPRPESLTPAAGSGALHVASPEAMTGMVPGVQNSLDVTIRPTPPATSPSGAIPIPPTPARRMPTLGLAGAGAFVVVMGIVLYTLRGGPGAGQPAQALPGLGGAAPGAGVPATPNAGSAAFAVSSVPSGAHIMMDGVDTGRVTPASLPLDGRYPKQLRLTLDGYTPTESSLSEADGKAGGRQFTLVKEAGPVRVLITGSYPFEVLQAGKVVSRASRRHEITLAPDELSIRLRSRESFLNAGIEVRPRGDARVELSAPDLGTLAVFSAVETCTVSIDGQNVGFPPIPATSVAGGSHTVGVKCPNGKSQNQNVTVTAGQRTAVTFDPSKS